MSGRRAGRALGRAAAPALGRGLGEETEAGGGDALAPLPAWIGRADGALGEAARRVRVVTGVTPTNWAEELGRLEADWKAGTERAPAFSYPPPADHAELRLALSELAGTLAGEGPLGAAYAERAEELCLEAELCELVGTAAFRGAAALRYARRDRFDDEADRLAESWAKIARAGLPGDAEAGNARLVASDDPRDPGSLLARMRAEVSNQKLPFRVVVADNLAPLAATGDGVIFVAAQKKLRAVDVERTVLHEVEGHAQVRFRARAGRVGLGRIGSARASDDEEGRALALERRRGFLRPSRRRELALRHVAARSALSGEGFVETARGLLRRGAPLRSALRVAARAHRGGGLGREVAYLPALLRVEDALARDPSLGARLARARLSVGAAESLAGWI